MPVQDKLAATIAALMLASLTNGPAALAAQEETKAKAPGLEEIHAKRMAARENLMVPSLAGLRGFAYTVVGSPNPESIEKKVGTKFEQLHLPKFTFAQLKSGSQPVDALVQLSFYRLDKHAIGELTVTQWVELARPPKSKIKAVTYRNRVFVPASDTEQAATELADQFIIDVLKANKKSGSPPANKA